MQKQTLRAFRSRTQAQLQLYIQAVDQVITFETHAYGERRPRGQTKRVD